MELFGKAFPGEENPVTYQNFGKATDAFERRLLTPAPWDDFLKGDDKALDKAQNQNPQLTFA